MGVQNLSKSVKICQSYWQKFAATFLCPTVYTELKYFCVIQALFVQAAESIFQSWLSPEFIYQIYAHDSLHAVSALWYMEALIT